MNMEIDSIAYVVVGVGINVNRMEFREDIAETATSLKKESGHSIERAELLSEILSAFFRDYKLFLRHRPHPRSRIYHHFWKVIIRSL